MIIGWGDIAVSGAALFGDILALLGAALATGYFFVGFRARQHLSLNAYTFLIYAAAAAVLFAYCVTLGVPLAGYADTDWAVFLGLAIFPTLLGHSVFNWSMRWVSATVISVVVLCEPIGASALAWLIFGTLPQLSHYIGGSAVLLGVLVFMRYRHPPPAASGAG
ncbi:DMT family transporter [Salinisphaera sp.]|uniref:DMT family transporter n=1 Tax=Salinisphaera sp. TaxID=1914330 RepID=UPI0025ECC3DC|nr:DMT family transporter [Salinisphaera sp.]